MLYLRKFLHFLVVYFSIINGLSAFEIDWDGSIGENEHKYIPAISNPLFNETPYITTEVRPILLHQKIPSKNVVLPVLGGASLLRGEVTVVAAEARMALTDNFGIIATKDGYAWIDFNDSLTNAAGIDDDDGFVNIALGFKYALFNDIEDQSIVSLGLKYEAPTGNLDLDLSAPATTLLGTGSIELNEGGDGFINPFISAAKRFDKVGLQGSAGTHIAIDNDHDSSMLHYSLHVDYEFTESVYPMLELNGFTVYDAGKRLPFGFDGVDLVNLGAGQDEGTVITAAGGLRIMATDNLMFGAGMEKAVGRDDLLDWRGYFDLILHF